ncbi:NAD-dependent epimerase/dehydratase family protein [Microbacterium sp. SSW1-59]|uniref:NAD-dependent epimerase/dehydratase family protein n=1 Tax=Microbacterium xanthum TaxID=3079794 RepID=UPI002AD42797|nr:NAD-dependent epimerase/dehydratase family protein [Microbacterium sp. SSW1-59]MDZ8202317.1 NAD-dependent epimerase/dehydratase family protein [Microbacterium sp. SSW1-59]
MRLLVTGGGGFIGTRLVLEALARGHEVRVLDSFRTDVHGAVAAFPRAVEVLHGDVRDPEMLDRALRQVDAVSHQAAKVGLGVDFADAPDYVSSNVSATAELLAAMKRAGVARLVLASSMVVYGEGVYTAGPGGPPARPAARRVADLEAGVFDPRDEETGKVLVPGLVEEDTPADPRNVYATTKLAQEHLAANWARETGGVVAALRYHNVYGPGMPRNTPYAGVASLFRSALERGEAPTVFEDGGQRRDFVHVDDVAAANLAALSWTGTCPPGTARPFNVASGHVVTIGEVARILSEAAKGSSPVVTGDFRRGDVRHITASPERARAELGWSALIHPAEGLRGFATAPLRA